MGKETLMAEINNLGDIQDSFNHINESLDSIRAQNAMNSGDLEKVLSEIKKNLDEKQDYVSDRFAEIEKAFHDISEKAGGSLTAAEVREVFDIIATNMNTFSKEVVTQKDVLNDIGLKIEELKQDDSQKKDILKNISVLKVEIEKFNNGFQSIIVNLNDNFGNVSQLIAKLDASERLDNVKKDIENIFLSTNAVLSTMQVIDHKNRELENAITNLVTKEDFEVEQKHVSTLISQNEKFVEFIPKLANQSGVDDLNEKIDTAVGVINALKTVLNDTSNQNQQMLVAQLERLEATVGTIISEEDFSKFRDDLLHIVEEGVQSSNLVRAELLDTNFEMKNFLTTINSLDLKTNFQNFVGFIKNTEETVKASIKDLSSRFLTESSQNKDFITTSITENIQEKTEAISQKIDAFESNAVASSKANLTNILESMQVVVNNILGLKNELHVENMENNEAVDVKFQDLKADLASSQEAIVKNSQQNLENIILNLGNIFQRLEATKEDLGQNSQENLAKILDSIAKLSNDLTIAKDGFDKNSQDNLTKIIKSVEELSNELTIVKDGLTQNSELKYENIISAVTDLAAQIDSIKSYVTEGVTSQTENIKLNFEEITKKIDWMKDGINKNAQVSLDSLEKMNEILTGVSEEVKTAKEGINENTQVKVDGILESISLISSQIQLTKDDLNINSKENLDKIVSNMESLSRDFSLAKEYIRQNSKSDSEEIIEAFNQLTAQFDTIKESFNTNAQERFESLLENISVVTAQVQSAKTGLNQNMQERFEIVLENMKELSSEVVSAKENFNQIAKDNAEGLKSIIGDLFVGVASIKDELEKNSKNSFSTLNSSIEELSQQLKVIEENFTSETLENFSGLKDSILALPGTIKENQTAFEKEKTTLLEQNSAQVEELTEKVQSLTQSIISKDALFKGEIKEEVSILKDLLASLEENLSQANFKVGEDLKSSINTIESLVSQANSSYDMSLYNLQVKLVEYLELIQNTTKQSDTKLENSVKELSDVRLDAQSIIEKLSTLNYDSNFSVLSIDINEKFQKVLDNITELEDISNSKNQDALQKTLTALENQFAGIQAKLEEYSKISDEKAVDSVEQITEQINTLKAQISLTNTDVVDVMNTKTNEVLSGFEPVKESIEKLAEVDFDKIAYDVKNQVDISYFNLTTKLKSDIHEENLDVIEKITETFDSLNEKLGKLSNDFDSKSSNNFEELKSMLESLTKSFEKQAVAAEKPQDFEPLEKMLTTVIEKLDEVNPSVDIQDIVNAGKEELVEKLDSVEKSLNKAHNELKASLQQGFEENASLIQENLEELISFKSDLLQEIDKVQAVVKEGASSNISELKSELDELVGEINKAQEEFSSQKLDLAELLKVKDDDAKEQIASIENIITEEISKNIDTFKSTVEDVVEKIEDKISLSEEKYKDSTHSLLSEIKTGFYEKVEDNIDDLKSFIEVLENKSDLSSIMDNLKSEVFEKLSILADDVEAIIGEISVKDDLKVIIPDIKNTISDVMENLYDRILLALEDDKLTQDVFAKSEEIARRVEDLKNAVTDDITDKLDNFGLSIDKQSEDFSNLMSEIRVSLGELKDTYVDLSLNSSMELSSLLTSVEEKISTIDGKLDKYNFTDLIEDSKNQLSKEISSVKEQLENINVSEKLADEFGVINQKLDALALESGNDLDDEISEIKEKIATQTKFIKELKALEKLDELSKLDGVADVQTEIKKLISEFGERLNKIASVKVGSKDEAYDIKEDLQKVRKDILENLLNIFEQVSFVVEAEEIKDFVEEKSEEIKEEIRSSLKSSLGDNFNDILSSLDDLHEKSNDVDGHCIDIKKDIGDVKKHLQSLQDFVEGTEGDASSYSYTLQDVESDIAKVRMILNELSKAKPDVQLEKLDVLDKLNQDIISISTRTNKLLLTSDESYNTLKENLNDFRNVVFGLEEKIKYVDNTAHNKQVEQGLAKINNLVLSSVKSDKIFNQAFMYLAEWVDNASENMSNIIDKVSDIDSVKLSIAEIKKNMPKKSDTEEILDALSEKFEQQQAKIDTLEKQIEQLSTKEAPVISKDDLKSVLEEILSQVEPLDKKFDVKLTKKVDSIDKQLAKLTKSIEKVTSYVDEV